MRKIGKIIVLMIVIIMVSQTLIYAKNYDYEASPWFNKYSTAKAAAEGIREKIQKYHFANLIEKKDDYGGSYDSGSDTVSYGYSTTKSVTVSIPISYAVGKTDNGYKFFFSFNKMTYKCDKESFEGSNYALNSKECKGDDWKTQARSFAADKITKFIKDDLTYFNGSITVTPSDISDSSLEAYIGGEIRPKGDTSVSYTQITITKIVYITFELATPKTGKLDAVSSEYRGYCKITASTEQKGSSGSGSSSSQEDTQDESGTWMTGSGEDVNATRYIQPAGASIYKQGRGHMTFVEEAKGGTEVYIYKKFTDNKGTVWATFGNTDPNQALYVKAAELWETKPTEEQVKTSEAEKRKEQEEANKGANGSWGAKANVEYSAGTPVTDPTDDANAYAPGNLNVSDAGELISGAATILGIIRNIGVALGVVALTVIGLRYMFASVEEKAEYKETMVPYVIGAILLMAGTTLVDVIYSLASNF